MLGVEMASVETALGYPKTPGFATTAGQEFEIHLCALVFLRALNSGLQFQLGSNVKGVGALDDLVFRCKTPREPRAWQTVFVQLKHKDKTRIRRVGKSMLTSATGDFSLARYFDSYFLIKQEMLYKKETLFDGSLEDSLFVIFTNAEGNDDLGREHCGNLSQGEAFFWFDSGSVFCSFENEKKMLECLGKCGKEGKIFLSRLRVFCSQPNARKLKVHVKEELYKLSAQTIYGLNIERLCDCYLGNVKDWWENRNTSDILDNAHNILLSAVDKVRLESSSEQTLQRHRLKLEFEEAALPSLDVGLSIVQCSADSFRLSLTKLVQASEGRFLVFTCLELLRNRHALLAGWSKGEFERLVVCTQDWQCNLEVKNVIHLIFRDTSSVQSIVFLHDENFSTVSQLTKVFPGKCRNFSDGFKISQLKDESRDQLLDKAVELQGHRTVLRQMFDDDRKSACEVLDASLVVDIMESAVPLTVGSALPEDIGYYVDRTLEWVCVKASVFADLRGAVTIRVTQKEAPARAFLDGAIDYLVTHCLDSPPYFSQINKEKLVMKLNQSPLFPDEDDGAVCIGPKFALGSYECNCVGLRFSQRNATTAFRACPTKEGSKQASFLFVSNEINEDDARRLSKFYQSKHFVSLQDGQLRWIRSQGDIELVRRHFCKDQVIRSAPAAVTDVEDRLVLVCAEPGMGKSTLMARLAKNTKAALPHYFVILLALNDHAEWFFQGKHKDVLDFLSRAAKMDSPLQRALLKHALDVSGNVVVIADGFDEVAPRYVDEFCFLVTSLLTETKISKIWITSRNSVKRKLETHFSIFATKMQPFENDGQREFLKKFWACKSSLSVEELDTFIDQLLAKTSHAVQDKENTFVGIPLQTMILAEVFEEHVTGPPKECKLPDHLDLLALLEQLIDKKFRVYVQNKLMLPSFKTYYEEHCGMLKKEFIDSHSSAALSLLLGEDACRYLGMDKIVSESLTLCKNISCGKEKTGFIDDIVNDEPRFVHRVFAEYVAAKRISEQTADYAELIRFMWFAADFAVVRAIFDRILARHCRLHAAVLDADLEKVRTLLDRDPLLVKVKDDRGRTALHLAAGLGTSEDREENVRRGDILDLLIGKTSSFDLVDDVLGCAPLGYADISQSWVALDKLLRKSDNNKQLALTSANITHAGMLETIFDLDLDRLLGFCLDHGLDVEHTSDYITTLLSRACSEGSLNVASQLIERNANIEHLDEFSQSPLHNASEEGHLDIVKLLCNKLIRLTSSNAGASCISNALKNYSNKQDTLFYWTALHFAAENSHTDVIRYLISQGSDTQICDNARRTPLHLAAGQKCVDAVRVLLEAEDEADRAAVVNSLYGNGAPALYYAAMDSSVECIELLVQAGAKLSALGFVGATSLMAAACRGRQEIVEWLLHNFCEEREAMTKLDYTNLRNSHGRTAMHMGLTDTIRVLISQGGDPLRCDNDKRTPLHRAASRSYLSAVRVLLEAVDEANRAMAVNLCDKFGDSVLMCACRATECSVECVALLVRAGAVLSTAGRHKQTSLMAAARNGKKVVVEYLLQNFNAQREGMSKADFIFLKDMNGRTVFHEAHAECQDVIEKCIKELCNNADRGRMN